MNSTFGFREMLVDTGASRCREVADGVRTCVEGDVLAGNEPGRVRACRSHDMVGDDDVEELERAGRFDEQKLARQHKSARTPGGRLEIVRTDAENLPGTAAAQFSGQKIHLRTADEPG